MPLQSFTATEARLTKAINAARASLPLLTMRLGLIRA
jgi:hypothetical protein